MEKSDVLYLIVGTNPMPNIITLLNRVKENGRVYLIQSDENELTFNTKKIANNIKSILKDKYKELRFDDIIVDKLNDGGMCSELENRYAVLMGEKVELNFTGGTKFMSSTIYGYFKEKQKSEGDGVVVLSYFDCEKNIFVYEVKKNNEIRVIEKGVAFKKISEILTLKDITKSHELDFEEISKGLEYKNIAEQMFLCFDGLTVEEKYEWLKDTNELYIKWRKDKNNLDKNEIVRYLRKYISLSEEDVLLKKDADTIIGYLTGNILEEYIFNILESLKNEGEIDSFVWSYQQNSTETTAGTEVDFVILKDLNTFLLSVTLCEEEGDCKFKLFEAKVRGEQVSGDETRIGFICLYNDADELKGLLDGEINSNKNLVVGIESFKDIRKQIGVWIAGGCAV